MITKCLSHSNLVAALIFMLFTIPVNSAPLELSDTEKEWVDNHKNITVYSGTNIPPFLFSVNKGTEAKGIAIDYLKTVFSNIGITPQFSDPMPFAEARIKLEKNEGIDLIPLAAVTPENKKNWGLTTPFYSTPLIIFSRKDESVITDIEQFEGRKIAYFKNARFVEILKKRYKNIEWIPYPELKHGFDDVASGKVDGIIVALTIGAFIINQNGLTNLKVATAVPFPPLDFAFAVNKDNSTFVALLSKAINSLSPEERNQINKKWLPVRFDHGLTFMDLAIWIILVAGTLSFIIIIFFLSNHRLKKEIDTRKKVEDELILARDIADSANRAKSNFLSTMSHELRTPLTSINGTIALAQSGILGELNDHGKKLMQAAHRNCDRLQYLINDLLDMEKINTGRLQLSLKIYDLDKILRDAIELNKSYAEKYKIRLIKKSADNSVFINSDNFRLTQVITNFISNACKFSEKNGEVIIRSEVIADKVRVSVENKGEEIPEEFKPFIFEKFSQADMSDTRSHSGSGLGLAISKEIIESMQGTIGFKSEKDAVTTFYFELPTTSELKGSEPFKIRSRDQNT